MNGNLPANRPSPGAMDAFHEDDVHAARIVVSLMTSVFLFGLVMYAFIMWLAM